jgi:hypothetical protein
LTLSSAEAATTIARMTCAASSRAVRAGRALESTDGHQRPWSPRSAAQMRRAAGRRAPAPGEEAMDAMDAGQ